MMYKIQRHLLFRLTKSFVFFLLLLLAIYTILDFFMRAGEFSDAKELNLFFMIRFYASEFIKRAVLLVPICFTLAMILQFIRLVKTKELVALLCAGISYRKILIPYWIMALILSSGLFLNRQFLTPSAREFLENSRNEHTRLARRSRSTEEQIYTLILKDDSKLIYQSYDPDTCRYFDVFWIVSPQRVLRIKYLEQVENGYKAKFVDELTRNSLGAFQKKHTFKELSFSKEWLNGSHYEKILPIQTQKITKMLKGITVKDYLYSKDEIYTELLAVIILSLSPLWIILLQAPLLTRYSRQIPVLFYVSGQLLLFFCTSTILDGLSIISQRSIVSPWLLIFTPGSIGLYFLIRRYRQKLI